MFLARTDSAAVAYGGFDPTDDEIYAVGPDSTQPLQLTSNAVADQQPSYSPVGARIVFMREYAIWVMDADGTANARPGRPRTVHPMKGPRNIHLGMASPTRRPEAPAGLPAADRSSPSNQM